MKRLLKVGVFIIVVLAAFHASFSSSSRPTLADGTAAPTAAATTAATAGACPKLKPAASATAAAAATTSTAATSAAPQPAGNTSSGNTSGSIAISGANALYPLVQVWGQEYGNKTGVQFDIQAGGAGKGMTDVLAGAVDIAMLSREAKKEEIAKGATVYPVAIDTVLFTISAQNPVAAQIAKTGLTCLQLQKIFTTGQKLTWGEIVGTDDKSPINVYTRADASGAADQVAVYLGATGQDDIKGTGVQGDNGIVQAVTTDPYGIGYNNPGFAYDPSTGQPVDGLAIVPLDQNGNGTLDPDEAVYATHSDLNAAIIAKKYPTPPTRNLYLVTKGPATGAAHDFIKWVLTDGQAFVEKSGFVKVSDGQIQQALDSLK